MAKFNGSAWKLVCCGLFVLVCGAFGYTWRADGALIDHTKLPDHAVAAERMSNLSKGQAENKAAIQRVESTVRQNRDELLKIKFVVDDIARRLPKK